MLKDCIAYISAVKMEPEFELYKEENKSSPVPSSLDSEIGQACLSLSKCFSCFSQCMRTLSPHKTITCSLIWAVPLLGKPRPPLCLSEAHLKCHLPQESSAHTVPSCVSGLTPPQDHTSGKVPCSPKGVQVLRQRVMTKDGSCRSVQQDVSLTGWVPLKSFATYCPMGERLRYEIRRRSREITLASDPTDLLSFQQ